METEVLFDVTDGIGTITLNRPNSLNALTLNMINKIRLNFTAWTEQDDIKIIIIKGSGDKAFCAGGDVIAVRQSIMDYDGIETSELAQNFFYEEYILNHQIYTCQKPYIAIIDRVCMGGGVGLSVHGSFRVATERTLVGMPETAIGLFPDVGGAWFLSRMLGEIGTYLALTGRPINAGDCIALGIATHLVSSSSLEELELNLHSSTFGVNAFQDIQKLLERFSISDTETPVLDLKTQIDTCFSASSVEEIITRLSDDKTEFGEETLKMLEKKSPTSLKVTLEQLRRGAISTSFGETLTMEFRMAQHFVRGNDFTEGVRALLVDKDNKPDWNPIFLEDVSSKDVAEYFEANSWRELKF